MYPSTLIQYEDEDRLVPPGSSCCHPLVAFHCHRPPGLYPGWPPPPYPAAQYTFPDAHHTICSGNCGPPLISENEPVLEALTDS